MKNKKRNFNALDKLFEDSIKQLNNLLPPNYEMMELTAIWLDKKVNGKVRFTEGDLIAVEDGKMIGNDHATHKVIGCFGDAHNTRLEFIISDVITNEVSILKIK